MTKINLVNIIKELIFPQSYGCPLCGRSGTSRSLCRACLESWSELAQGLQICDRCGRFRCNAGTVKLCGDCQKDEPPFVLARGVVPYEGPVRDALHLFKFAGKQELAEPFAELMAGLVAALFPYRTFAAVVPVPLHPVRERERRFNQASLLAGVIARFLGLRLAKNVLLRGKDTFSQTGLSCSSRKDNLIGAFLQGDGLAPLQGKSVLLVDDVFTTGATAGECCRTLLAAGIGSVYVVTLAAGVNKDQQQGDN